MKSDNLIFLHIPKAAGSTLHPVLERHYPRGRTCTVSLPEQVEAFTRRPEPERSRIRLLKGHMPFGMHAWLAGPSRYITLLRHPVERVVSHYFYVKRRPDHYLHEVVARGMSLAEYASAQLSGELDNGQVRLLAGHDQDIPCGSCTDDLLETAKRNVERHFAAVGLTERFDESLVLMARALGWSWTPYYHNKNVTEGRPSGKQIGDDARDAICRANALDMALYGWAKARFDAQIDAQREQIEHSVARLRRSCRRYRPFGELSDVLRRGVKAGTRMLQGST